MWKGLSAGCYLCRPKHNKDMNQRHYKTPCVYWAPSYTIGNTTWRKKAQLGRFCKQLNFIFFYEIKLDNRLWKFDWHWYAFSVWYSHCFCGVKTRFFLQFVYFLIVSLDLQPILKGLIVGQLSRRLDEQVSCTLHIKLQWSGRSIISGPVHGVL